MYFTGHGRFKSERNKTDLERERRIREQQERKIRREEREKEREARRQKDTERQKARLKERENRRNERLKERANNDKGGRDERTKWKPVSKEVDWKRENLEKKKEIDKRVGAADNRRSRERSDVKVRERPNRSNERSNRSGFQPKSGSDSSDEESAKAKIPALMSIVTKDVTKTSRSRDTTSVDRNKDDKKTMELVSASRKRKLQQMDQEKEKDEAKRRPTAIGKVEQKIKERKQQKQLPSPPPQKPLPPPPPAGREKLKQIEQRLKERKEKSKQDIPERKREEPKQGNFTT